jgi:RNA polymerase sigma-70 factor (ECF subfamily)
MKCICDSRKVLARSIRAGSPHVAGEDMSWRKTMTRWEWLVSDEQSMGTGDPTPLSFESLFDTYATDVYRYVHRRTTQSDADDIVAEVFLIAWRRRSVIPAGFERPWLFRTAWNVLANARRKFVELPFEDLPNAPRMTDVADIVIEDDLLRRAWMTLSPRDQEVIRLVSWDGLDSQALAAALGMSVGGATAALSRARARLAVALDTSERADERRTMTPADIEQVGRSRGGGAGNG